MQQQRQAFDRPTSLTAISSPSQARIKGHAIIADISPLHKVSTRARTGYLLSFNSLSNLKYLVKITMPG